MNNNTLKFDTHNDIEETARQQKFMEKAKAYVEELTCKLGRKPTYCVTTFGCQMNARDSEKLAGILNYIGYEKREEEQADTSGNTSSIFSRNTSAASSAISSP